MLDNGARINEVDYEGHTALMMSAIRQNSDAVKFLLERGADASLRDKDGKTALDFALEEKNFLMSFDVTLVALLEWGQICIFVVEITQRF
ncbi:MAG: ankyrin repeat domain-containing protein [Clostridia bacterium]|nr:ankyrin repeat domain-containing protein [Clostridia bacterium]